MYCDFRQVPVPEVLGTPVLHQNHLLKSLGLLMARHWPLPSLLPFLPLQHVTLPGLGLGRGKQGSWGTKLKKASLSSSILHLTALLASSPGQLLTALLQTISPFFPPRRHFLLVSLLKALFCFLQVLLPTGSPQTVVSPQCGGTVPLFLLGTS